jgi:large repetitive protein
MHASPVRIEYAGALLLSTALVSCAAEGARSIRSGMPDRRPVETATEFRANTARAANQWHPSVAALKGGGFVVVWESFDFHGDTSCRLSKGSATCEDVYARVYDAAGVPAHPEFRVNRRTAGDQWESSVAALSDGGFIVVWTSTSSQGGDIYDVVGQRYDASAKPVGPEFRANPTARGTQHEPAVAGLSNGGFVVTWRSYHPQGGPTSISGQRYDAVGNPVGKEFDVGLASGVGQPSVAGLVNDGFVVLWSEDDDLCARRYVAGGTPASDGFLISKIAFRHANAAVVALSGGGFATAWTSSRERGNGSDVYGRRYGAAGTPDGDAFRINDFTNAADETRAAIAAVADGGFVVTWKAKSAGDTALGDIYTKRFDGRGDLGRVGLAERRVTGRRDVSASPSVAVLPSSGIVVTWSSYEGFDSDIQVKYHRKISQLYLSPEPPRTAEPVADSSESASGEPGTRPVDRPIAWYRTRQEEQMRAWPTQSNEPATAQMDAADSSSAIPCASR